MMLVDERIVKIRNDTICPLTCPRLSVSRRDYNPKSTEKRRSIVQISDASNWPGCAIL